MRRILVTGASGFVGGHICGVLRAAFPDASLVAATRGSAVQGWDAVVTLDLADAASCAAAVHGARPDAVIHLAALAETGASFRDPHGTWRVNLLGTLAIAEAVMAHAGDALFLYASSAEVYGLSFQEGRKLTEDALLRPANPYAASKAAADLAVSEMALRGLRAVRLRPFNHTGAGQANGFVVADFARQVAMMAAGLQDRVVRVGALDRWRDFLDVGDVCAGYAAVLRAADRLQPGAVFNLASGVPRHIGSILETLLSMAGISADVVQEPAQLRTTDVPLAIGDASAARDALAWAPTIPWETTLNAVLTDWQARLRALPIY